MRNASGSGAPEGSELRFATPGAQAAPEKPEARPWWREILGG